MVILCIKYECISDDFGSNEKDKVIEREQQKHITRGAIRNAV